MNNARIIESENIWKISTAADVELLRIGRKTVDRSTFAQTIIPVNFQNEVKLNLSLAQIRFSGKKGAAEKRPTYSVGGQ